MEISAALTSDLAALNAALDDDIDLEATLRSLVADAKTSVASICAITLAVAVDGHQVSLTIGGADTDHPEDGDAAVGKITTSLRIPLQGNHNAEAGSYLVLYAVTPGAFVDLAADIGYALGLDATSLRLDGHIDAPPPGTGITGLAAHSVVNQAVGILIGRGFLVPAAHAELRRLADHAGEELAVAADRLLRSTSRPRLAGEGA